MMERDLWRANSAAVDEQARAGCIKLARACAVIVAAVFVGCVFYLGVML